MLDISSQTKLKESKNKKIQYILALTLIYIFLPIGGYFILKTLGYPSEEETDLINDKNIDKNEHKTNYLDSKLSNMLIESDFVALEDSLNISEYNYRRRIILDLLSRNNMRYFKLINKALENSDQETVHYAATSILGKKIKQKYEYEIAYKNYNKDPMNPEIVKAYIQSLENQLTMPYLEHSQKEFYINTIINTLKRFIDNKKNEDDFFIIKLLNYSIGIKDAEKIKFYTSFYKHYYKDSEAKYMMLLKCYFTLGDDINFKGTLVNLKSIGNMLSKKGIETLHFWGKEAI